MEEETKPGRRDFLKAAGLAGIGAAAAIPVTLIGEDASAAESADEQVKARYRESDHVKRFYFLNRL